MKILFTYLLTITQTVRLSTSENVISKQKKCFFKLVGKGSHSPPPSEILHQKFLTFPDLLPHLPDQSLPRCCDQVSLIFAPLQVDEHANIYLDCCCVNLPTTCTTDCLTSTFHDRCRHNPYRHVTYLSNKIPTSTI